MIVFFLEIEYRHSVTFIDMWLCFWDINSQLSLWNPSNIAVILNPCFFKYLVSLFFSLEIEYHRSVTFLQWIKHLQSDMWLCSCTEKTIFLFPFKLNGIWSWWQFSFQKLFRKDSLPFDWYIERKTVTHDHIPFSLKGNWNIVFSVQAINSPSDMCIYIVDDRYIYHEVDDI